MAYNPHRRARVATIARDLGADEAELCRRMHVTPSTVVLVSKALVHVREMKAAEAAREERWRAYVAGASVAEQEGRR